MYYGNKNVRKTNLHIHTHRKSLQLLQITYWVFHFPSTLVEKLGEGHVSNVHNVQSLNEKLKAWEEHYQKRLFRVFRVNSFVT